MNEEEIRKRRQREYARKYYEEHKEELRKKKNDYRKNNLDKYKKNQKKYYQKNKDYYKNYSKEWSKQKQHELLDEIDRLKQELQRKDNNWNELKKYVDNLYEDETYHSIGEVLDKIEELENDIK